MLKAFIVDCIGNPKLYHCTISDDDKVVLKMSNETHTFRQICDTIDGYDILNQILIIEKRYYNEITKREIIQELCIKIYHLFIGRVFLCFRLNAG